MFALLSSSQPNIVNVPPSAVITDAKAPFTATVAPLDAPATVTVSATMDGVMISKPMSVRLPQIIRLDQSMQSGPSGIATEGFAGDTIGLKGVFDGKLRSSALVDITASDTAVRIIPGTSRWDSFFADWRATLAVSPALTEVRQVTFTATYAGSTKTSTLTARPILISSFAATPSAGRAGSAMSATTRLSRTPRVPMTVRYVSGDPTMASVPSNAQNVNGNSHVVPITITGTPATTRAVPITVTLYSQGVIIYSRTITITVNP